MIKYYDTDFCRFKGTVQNQYLKEINRKLAIPYIQILPKEHAAIVRKVLAKEFPNIKWKVTSRSANGDGVIVVKTDADLKMKTYLKVHHLVDAFSGYDTDLLGNCYNTGFEYNGKRYRGALFCKLIC